MKKLTKNQRRKKELKRRIQTKQRKLQKLNDRMFNKNIEELDSAIAMFEEEINKLEKEHLDD